MEAQDSWWRDNAERGRNNVKRDKQHGRRSSRWREKKVEQEGQESIIQ